ncbi:hypothetical protein EVAR_3925_1 [Eumeta japonica]|uniref:Uncharacterized protein n=1 Tax=Eumeta variegata TaxID=151549 RepID=A0A4C1SR10_EUMVA|nr:hypothetical protein EVAR_3925_1 [Eumeta japonica]
MDPRNAQFTCAHMSMRIPSAAVYRLILSLASSAPRSQRVRNSAPASPRAEFYAPIIAILGALPRRRIIVRVPTAVVCWVINTLTDVASYAFKRLEIKLRADFQKGNLLVVFVPAPRALQL